MNLLYFQVLFYSSCFLLKNVNFLFLSLTSQNFQKPCSTLNMLINNIASANKSYDAIIVNSSYILPQFIGFFVFYFIWKKNN